MRHECYFGFKGDFSETFSNKSRTFALGACTTFEGRPIKAPRRTLPADHRLVRFPDGKPTIMATADGPELEAGRHGDRKPSPFLTKTRRSSTKG